MMEEKEKQKIESNGDGKVRDLEYLLKSKERHIEELEKQLNEMDISNVMKELEELK